MNTMKKKYIAPAIEVVEMEPISMCAVSNNESIGGDKDTPPAEELSNRRRNFWDEVGSDRGW